MSEPKNVTDEIGPQTPLECGCGQQFQARRVCGVMLPPKCPKCLPQEPGKPLGTLEDYRILTLMARAGVNVHKYQDATLENFDPDPDNQAMEAAQDFLDSWLARDELPFERHDWLFFYGADSAMTDGNVQVGATGNGKTFLGIALARALLESKRIPGQQAALNAIAYHFTTVEGFILETEATFRQESVTSELSLIARYSGYKLLHLDDFGVRAPSNHAVRVLDELAKSREGKATIWTSNLSPKVIAEQHPGLIRIVSRIVGECGEGRKYIVPFKGPDRRFARAKRTT